MPEITSANEIIKNLRLTPRNQKICECGNEYFDTFDNHPVCPDCEVKQQSLLNKQQSEVKILDKKEEFKKLLLSNTTFGDYLKKYKNFDKWYEVIWKFCQGRTLKDLEGELNRMDLWLLSNPPKKQWERFIGTWLTKEKGW